MPTHLDQTIITSASNPSLMANPATELSRSQGSRSMQREDGFHSFSSNNDSSAPLSDSGEARSRKIWASATDDNPLTLFGFRRFRTSHLVNLRYLEHELAEVDRQLYEAGERLNVPLPPKNKLGLGYSKSFRSSDTESSLDRELVTKLRRLVKEYGMEQNQTLYAG